MASLLDIAPSLRTVSVHGVAIAVPGISIDGIAALLTRFDELRAMLTGQPVELTAEVLAGTGPAVVAAVIAAGTGHPGDEAHEAVAADLSLSEQVDLLAAILEATFPDGMGKLAARLADLAKGVGIEAGLPKLSPPSASA